MFEKTKPIQAKSAEFITIVAVKHQAENNFRFLSEPWSFALRILSSRSWR
jgi:hypothetical protein